MREVMTDEEEDESEERSELTLQHLKIWTLEYCNYH